MFNKKQIEYIATLFLRKKRYDMVKLIRNVKELTWEEARRECWLIKYKKGEYFPTEEPTK